LLVCDCLSALVQLIVWKDLFVFVIECYVISAHPLTTFVHLKWFLWLWGHIRYIILLLCTGRLKSLENAYL